MKIIIKKGNQFETECSNCGCIFKYEKEDIECKEEDKWGRAGYYYVTCPCCENMIGH